MNQIGNALCLANSFYEFMAYAIHGAFLLRREYSILLHLRIMAIRSDWSSENCIGRVLFNHWGQQRFNSMICAFFIEMRKPSNTHVPQQSLAYDIFHIQHYRRRCTLYAMFLCV